MIKIQQSSSNGTRSLFRAALFHAHISSNGIRGNTFLHTHKSVRHFSAMEDFRGPTLDFKYLVKVGKDNFVQVQTGLLLGPFSWLVPQVLWHLILK